MLPAALGLCRACSRAVSSASSPGTGGRPGSTAPSWTASKLPTETTFRGAQERLGRGVGVSRTKRKVRNRKPYEFEDDDDPFIVVGIDAEWVYESEGRNHILSCQFAVHNDDIGQTTTLIVYPKH